MARLTPLAAVLAVSLGLAACGGTESETTPAAPPSATQPPGTTSGESPANTAAPSSTSQPPVNSPAAVMPNEVGKVLQEAQDDLQAKGVAGFSTSHDLTGQTQFQVNDRAWKVCTQTPRAGQSVDPNTPPDFGVVRIQASCP